MGRSARLRGFTLVELLVVIAIIGILIALLLPAVQAARDAARRTHCVNNMKQIGLALQSYHDTKSEFPFATAYFLTPAGTWASFILPYIEQQAQYDQFDFNTWLSDPVNTVAVTTPVATMICPSDPQAGNPILAGRGDTGLVNPPRSFGLWYPVSMGPTHPDACPFCPDPNPGPDNWCCQGYNLGTMMPKNNYVGMFGRYPKGISMRHVSDGLSNTLMAGETLPGHCIFNGAYVTNYLVLSTTIPLNTMESDNGVRGTWFRTCGFKSLHPGGANMLMGDASVQFLSEAIDFRLYNNLGTRAGGEAVVVPQ
jgi:prepilin-type N-terminal cleavage/methylation domain-containing protein/prepilin-type processing-associated H-X9-DG protein